MHSDFSLNYDSLVELVTPLIILYGRVIFHIVVNWSIKVIRRFKRPYHATEGRQARQSTRAMAPSPRKKNLSLANSRWGMYIDFL